MDQGGLGKALILIGFVIALIGGLVLLSARFEFLGRLGRLPGDINWQGENWRVSFPLMTSLLVSVVLSLLFWLVSIFSTRGGGGAP
jgi:hypothetical protein